MCNNSIVAMNSILIFCALNFSMHFFVSAQTSISTARALPLGSTVTISGIVTNGAELGTIRFIQDGTAGIAIFSSSLANAQRSDEITVTGITTEYQNLLEIQPVTNWSVNSTGNILPSPFILTPAQLNENSEGQLVTINNVVFTNAGGIFQGNTTTSFTSNGESGVIYLNNSHTLVGTSIPGTQVSITGILSQFGSQYQMLLRDANDISSTSAISIISPPVPANILTNSFDISWITNISGTTILQYGKTPALELGYLSGIGGTNHTVSITGAQPSEIYYAKAMSVSGADTAFSGTIVFITASNSSGDIKVYFNKTVEHNVSHSPSNFAVQLNYTLADTIAAFIDRAMQAIDICIYNFSAQGTQTIINALNNAFSQGTQVRIIADGGNTNSALASLNPAIPVLPSPVGSNYGLMHNKFMIIDADATDPNLSFVFTGSTNWTDSQINTDRNNTVIIQDQSLARAYKLEFEEMWGASTVTPGFANSKFGQFKTDNTPHHFVINGKKVENYFSPSDHTNYKLIETINTADAQLFFALLVCTRFDVANAIAAKSGNGVYTAGILNDTGSGGGQAYDIIQSLLGSNLLLFDHSTLPGILHHKYLIVDQNAGWSDPRVWTGSHNWSTAANTRNDENTLVIHDHDIANQFYQEFVKLFNDNGGVLSAGNENSFIKDLMLYPNPSAGRFYFNFLTEKEIQISIKIYDQSGRIIYSEGTATNPGLNTRSLNLQGAANGMYYLEFSAENEFIRFKIILRN